MPGFSTMLIIHPLFQHSANYTSLVSAQRYLYIPGFVTTQIPHRWFQRNANSTSLVSAQHKFNTPRVSTTRTQYNPNTERQAEKRQESLISVAMLLLICPERAVGWKSIER